jgi:hypothetical protein
MATEKIPAPNPVPYPEQRSATFHRYLQRGDGNAGAIAPAQSAPVSLRDTRCVADVRAA